MVKIISKGVIAKDIEHTIQCRSCQSVFSYANHEAKMNYDQRDGDYQSIDCPVCGAMVTKQWRG